MGNAGLWAIPLASAIISIATLIYASIGIRHSADAKHVEHLEQELADARAELDRADARLTVCETDRGRLRDEVTRMGQREVELMRMVVDLQRKAGT